MTQSFHIAAKPRGFTLVELTIAIAVIAILAVITVVAYNGVQERTRHAAYLSALDSYEQLLRSYKAARGSYPATVRVEADGITEIATSAKGGTGAMACLGDPSRDYLATSGISANTCLAGDLRLQSPTTGSLSFSGNVAQVSPEINDALTAVSAPLPSVPNLPKPVIGTGLNVPIGDMTLSSNSFVTRGIIYRSQQKADGTSQATSLLFFNYGEYDCGRFLRWNGTLNGQKISICASILT